MHYNEIWYWLMIQETNDIAAIKAAYRGRLKITSPEDDQEGFMKLREAYERALDYAKTHQEVYTSNRNLSGNEREDYEDELYLEDDEHDEYHRIDMGYEDRNVYVRSKTEIDLWLEQVNTVYQNMDKRIDSSAWEELFCHEVCSSLDQSIDARNCLLNYLMSNYHLPCNVWRAIDREFHILEDKENLLDLDYPERFLDYFYDQVHNESMFNYQLFQVKAGENYDQFIQNYEQLKQHMDNGHMDEFDSVYGDFQQYETYHPYVDVEKVRYEIKQQNLQVAAKLMEKVLGYDTQDAYIQMVYGFLKVAEGNYEEAIAIFTVINPKLKSNSIEQYTMYIDWMYSYESLERYQEAKKLAEDMIRQYPFHTVINQNLHRYNERLIEDYLQKIENESDDALLIDLACCYQQNNRNQEAIDCLMKLPEEYKQQADYLNLTSRIYYSNCEYQKAIQQITQWIQSVENSTKEDKQLSYAYSILGISWCKLGDYDKAINSLSRANELETNPQRVRINIDYLAYCYLQRLDFSKVIATTNLSIQINDPFHPANQLSYRALLYRMEAYLELYYLDEVARDFKYATDMMPQGIVPYVYMIKAYIYAKELEKAERILTMAKERGLSSNRLDLAEIMIRVKQVASSKDMRDLTDRCDQLRVKLDDPNNDIISSAEILYQKYLLTVKLESYEESILLIDEVIASTKNNLKYYYSKSWSYIGLKKWQEAIDLILMLMDRGYDKADLKYHLADCYKSMGDIPSAIHYFKLHLEENPYDIDGIKKLIIIYEDIFLNNKTIENFENYLYYINMRVEHWPNEESYGIRGHCYFMNDDLDKALENYETAIKLGDVDWKVWRQIAVIHHRRRDLEKAAFYYEKAMEQVTVEENGRTYVQCSSVYRELEEYDKCLNLLLYIHQAYPAQQHIIHCILDIYYIKKDFVRANLWLEKLDKGSIYHRYLGKLRLLEGKLEEGIKEYSVGAVKLKDCLTAVPYYTILLLRGSATSVGLGIRGFKNLSSIEAKNRIDLYLEFALVLWSSKLFISVKSRSQLKYKDLQNLAKKFAEMAMEQIKALYSSPDAYGKMALESRKNSYYLACYYLVMEDKETAEKLLNEIFTLEIDGNSMSYKVQTYQALAYLHLDKGDFKATKEYYEEILRIDPSDKIVEMKLENMLQRMAEVKN